MSWLICCLYLVGCSRVVIGVGRMSENAGQTTTSHAGASQQALLGVPGE